MLNGQTQEGKKEGQREGAGRKGRGGMEEGEKNERRGEGGRKGESKKSAAMVRPRLNWLHFYIHLLTWK